MMAAAAPSPGPLDQFEADAEQQEAAVADAEEDRYRLPVGTDIRSVRILVLKESSRVHSLQTTPVTPAARMAENHPRLVAAQTEMRPARKEPDRKGVGA